MQVSEVTSGAARAPVAGAGGRVGVVRALALSLDRCRGVEAMVDRAVASLPADHPSDEEAVATSALGAAWRAPAPIRLRGGQPTLAADRSELDAALARLEARERLIVVLAVWAGWAIARIGTALELTRADVSEELRRALERLGLHGPEDAATLRDHLASCAAAIAVTASGWEEARARGGRRERRIPLFLMLAGGALLAAVALLGGGSSGPAPTIVRPAPARSLAVPAAPEPVAVAPIGPPLAWARVDLPAGVSFGWIQEFRGGFVALETDPDLFPGVTSRPIGVWTSPDGVAWIHLDADLSTFADGDLVTAFATSPGGMLVLGGGPQRGDLPGAVETVFVWESTDGVSWRRHVLPAPYGAAAEHMRWSYAPTGVAAVDGKALVVGLALQRADVAALVADRVPDPLPDGFQLHAGRGSVDLFGPGGLPVAELDLADFDVGSLPAQETLRSAAWTRQSGGPWEAVDLPGVRSGALLTSASVAGDRLWVTGSEGDGSVAYSSDDGLAWEPVPGFAGTPAGPIAGHRTGLAAALGGLIVQVSGGDEWARVRLPAVSTTSAGAHAMAGGGLGVIAYGAMGSVGSQVFTPVVTVPGDPGPATVNIETGLWRIPQPGGEVRVVSSYPGGALDVDFDSGTFHVLDPDTGGVLFTGGIAEWAAAADRAFRTGFPPTGPVAVWYSADGKAWRLHGPEDGMEAIGYPIAVAVGDTSVVVAAVTTDPAVDARTAARVEVWVGS